MTTNDVTRNVQTVNAIYEAFGKGDVSTILERLAEDVDWEFATGPNDVPWLQPGRGRAAAARFFEAIGGGLEIRDFRVHAVMGEGEWVVGLVMVEGVAKRTGRRVSEPCEAHIWRFDGKGRVVAMRHAADTLQQQRACEAR
ncbi:MAG: nuclear transport factor 2 family protein [Sandaracinaceae bacterium]